MRCERLLTMVEAGNFRGLASEIEHRIGFLYHPGHLRERFSRIPDWVLQEFRADDDLLMWMRNRLLSPPTGGQSETEDFQWNEMHTGWVFVIPSEETRERMRETEVDTKHREPVRSKLRKQVTHLTPINRVAAQVTNWEEV